jgi:hypothetical protein
MTSQYFLTIVGCVVTLAVSSQESHRGLSSQHYEKIVVETGNVTIIQTDSVNIDTLILNDEAGLSFPQNTIVVVNNAFIGKACRITCRSGRDGHALALLIHFRVLGSLVINTSGINGYSGRDGANGRNGQQGQNGEDGQNGHPGTDGGNGGDITFLYIADDVIPVLKGTGDRSIQFEHAGGIGGVGGAGGQGGRGGAPIPPEKFRDGWHGRRGASGKNGKDGELFIQRVDKL